MSKSYEFREAPEAPHHEIYNAYIKKLSLKNHHHGDLSKRGLDSKHIIKGGYATKPRNNVLEADDALGHVDTNYNIDEVPGFFRDPKKNNMRSQAGTAGLVIPVRDVNGHIASLLIRNDSPKFSETGKPTNKYLLFSSKDKPKGNKVKLTTHCPIIKGTAKNISGTTIRITEGILKADVATALDPNGIYCLGMHGLNVQSDLEQVLTEIEADKLLIALDAGEDANSDMIAAKGKLLSIAKKMGIDFEIETWNPELGKGIDDVLRAGHANKISFASKDVVDEILNQAHENNPENGEWIYVIQPERFYHVKTLQNWGKSQYANRFRINKLQTVNDILSDDFPMVDQLIYEPGKDIFLKEKSVRFLNTWRGPGILPQEGDIKPFLKHTEYLFPDNELYQSILLDYLAYNHKYPGKKIRWALTLQGIAQGTGKSFYAETCMVTLGPDNVNSPSMEAIHSQFTGWQKSCQLIVIEELMAQGKYELMNKLKPMIVSDRTTIREMRRDEYEQPNRYNFLCSTNYEDAIMLEESDRRYAIIRTNAEPKDTQYYVDLFDWLKKPETAPALLHFFLSRDLSNFNPYFAPMTEAKKQTIAISLTALEEWVMNGIKDYCWPFNREIVVTRHLNVKDLCPFPDRYKGYKWAQAFRKSGAIEYPHQIPLSDGSRANPWLVGPRKHLLKDLPPKELAKQYEKESGIAGGDILSQKADIVNPILETKPM